MADISIKDQPLADGDSSQVTVSVEEVVKASTGKKRKINDFISMNEFQSESSRITKWGDLPLNVIYRIKNVNEELINREGEKVISKYAELENEAGDMINVWLTSVIEKELKDINDYENEHIYVRTYGLKTNQKGNRKYHDFEIVKRKK